LREFIQRIRSIAESISLSAEAISIGPNTGDRSAVSRAIEGEQ
jgi:hypothetical protein